MHTPHPTPHTPHPTPHTPHPTPHNQRFYDQVLSAIEQGFVSAAIPMLVGKLYADFADEEKWPTTRAELHLHPLHAVLMEDPYVRRAAQKPRGYAGDADLIDFAYDQKPPDNTNPRACELFACTTGFQASSGVRNRRKHTETMLLNAWLSKKQVCVLACGHLREADLLIGKDLSNIIAVDQDPTSLRRVKEIHDGRIRLAEANAIHFLRKTAKSGEKFDLIYSLGMTDYFDSRAMSLLHRLMRDCLAPSGTIMVANFLPNHLAVGWMDAVMDWKLIYRDESEMERHAAEIGMKAKTFRDTSDSIVFCEMTKD